MSIFSLSKRERYKLYEKYEIAINWACVLMAFAITLIITRHFVFCDMSKDDFKACEKIVHSVYNQKAQGNVLYEVPEGFSVDISATEITARKLGLHMGIVRLYVFNNEIIVEKDNQEFVCTLLSVLMSIIVVLFKFLWLASYNLKYGGPTKIIRFIK